jgi:hypothetical protein
MTRLSSPLSVHSVNTRARACEVARVDDSSHLDEFDRLQPIWHAREEEIAGRRRAAERSQARAARVRESFLRSPDKWPPPP